MPPLVRCLPHQVECHPWVSRILLLIIILCMMPNLLIFFMFKYFGNNNKFLQAATRNPIILLQRIIVYALQLQRKYTQKLIFCSLLQGTSWSCPSPTLTPPFPLPPTDEGDPDPVEALLQLAANGRQSSLASSGGGQATNGVTSVTGEHESDEGIVSDQSNEFEDKKVSAH